MCRETLCDRFDGRCLRQHAYLHGGDVEIREHRIDLRPGEIGRDIVNGAYALRVLRGQGGDDGGAVNSECSECLEIRLDASAAARVRTGNGDGDRGHGEPRRESTPSTTARKSCAAASGSGASERADITATPSAPAAITSAALSALMPAMAQMG